MLRALQIAPLGLGLAAVLLLAPGRAAAAGESAAPAPGETRAADADDAAVPDGCAERTATRVQQRYEKVRDLRARFEQTTRPAGAAVAEPTTSRGTVVLAKPGKLRWSYEEPEPSLVVSDGTTLWVYDPVFGEAQRLAVIEGYLSGAAIQFLLGEGDIFREFHVRAVSCEEARVELELIPREPASYEKIGLVVDAKTGDLLRTRLVDLIGTVIEVKLSDLQVNQSPPASLFRFDPPEGVRVMDLQP